MNRPTWELDERVALHGAGNAIEMDAAESEHFRKHTLRQRKIEVPVIGQAHVSQACVNFANEVSNTTVEIPPSESRHVIEQVGLLKPFSALAGLLQSGVCGRAYPYRVTHERCVNQNSFGDGAHGKPITRPGHAGEAETISRQHEARDLVC